MPHPPRFYTQRSVLTISRSRLVPASQCARFYPTRYSPSYASRPPRRTIYSLSASGSTTASRTSSTLVSLITAGLTSPSRSPLVVGGAARAQLPSPGSAEGRFPLHPRGQLGRFPQQAVHLSPVWELARPCSGERGFRHRERIGVLRCRSPAVVSQSGGGSEWLSE